MTQTRRRLSKSLGSPRQKDFCQLMAQVRREVGLTQKDLADRLGRPQSFVAKYEGGERRIDVIEFVAIAQALDSDPIGLLKRLLRSSKSSSRS